MQNIFFRYNRDRKEAFLETIKYTILVVAMLVLIRSVPVFSLSALILPSVLALITYRNGMAFAFISSLITAIAASVFMDPIIVIYTVFTIGGVGMITGELSYRKRKPALAIFGGAFMVTLNILLLMYAQARMMNVDLVDYIISIYRESFEVQKEMMGLDIDVETFLLNLRRTFPGMVVCMGFAVSAVNYFLSGMMLSKITKKREIATLSEFTLPGNVFGGMLIIYLMTALLNYTDFVYKETLILNLTIIFGMLFFLQGIAAINNFMSRRLRPVARNIITVILCTFMPFYTFVVAIGFVDAVMNLRRLKK